MLMRCDAGGGVEVWGHWFEQGLKKATVCVLWVSTGWMCMRQGGGGSSGLKMGGKRTKNRDG